MAVVGALSALSRGLARLERAGLVALVAGVAGLVLANVGFRATGRTLAWADELAILGMTLMAFVGTSLLVQARTAPSVLLVHQVVPAGVVRGLRAVASGVSAAFGGTLVWLCWRWLDPVGLAAAGFDIAAYEAASFNFVYTETTPVMRLPRVWFFLVLPWFGLSLAIHGLANLAEDVRLLAAPRPGGMS